MDIKSLVGETTEYDKKLKLEKNETEELVQNS